MERADVELLALVVARPVNVDAISRAAVYPDLLSGGVMELVDPDVVSGEPMSLKTIPGVDGDACHTEWREMVLDDIVMEKFALVPEVCPVGSMTSATEPTFLPALSEVYSFVVLAGGIVAAANPLAVVESDTVRVSALLVELDIARVSALPVVGNEVPAVYFGMVTLDSVGVRVGPSCLQLDPEDSPPALLDERGVMTDVHLGVSPDGGPMAWAPVLEPLEHSVLEKSPDGGFTEGTPILEPLQHSVLEKSPDDGCKEGASVLEPLEHSVREKALDDRPMVGFAAQDPLDYSLFDVDMISLWMAPWDAGGTFRIGSRPKMAIRRD